MKTLCLSGLLVVWVVIGFYGPAACMADAIQIGTGGNSAGLYIEWKDYFSAEFEVHFDDPSIGGLELFDAVEAETSLMTDRKDYGWGMFIDGISYEGHENSGFLGGEDWWHYWVKDGTGDWESPSYGVGDRTLADGDMDGWVYGRATIPEPATIGLMLIGTVAAGRRSRRRLTTI